jgi:hypothetical protein
MKVFMIGIDEKTFTTHHFWRQFFAPFATMAKEIGLNIGKGNDLI